MSHEVGIRYQAIVKVLGLQRRQHPWVDPQDHELGLEAEVDGGMPDQGEVILHLAGVDRQVKRLETRPRPDDSRVVPHHGRAPHDQCRRLRSRGLQELTLLSSRRGHQDGEPARAEGPVGIHVDAGDPQHSPQHQRSPKKDRDKRLTRLTDADLRGQEQAGRYPKPRGSRNPLEVEKERRAPENVAWASLDGRGVRRLVPQSESSVTYSHAAVSSGLDFNLWSSLAKSRQVNRHSNGRATFW